MRMGGGPQQFGVDAEKVPALLADLVAADVDFLGFHVFAGSQNLSAEILCEAQRKTVELVLRAGREIPADPLRQPRRRLRHPVLRQGSTARPVRHRGKPRRTARHRDRAEPARRTGGDRARPVHRRRVRGLRHTGRRPQGVPGPHLSCRRRWPAPPAGRIRQLRTGDPTQLPDRDRQSPS